jgi:3-methylcrotonyl-CoA carboxylase alpha subunit
MISKIIVHGPTRAVALKQLDRALARTEVAGSVTNLAFLRALAGHAGFAAGDVDTGLIDRDLETLAADPQPCSRTKALAALGALDLIGPADPLQGFSLWAPLRQAVALDAGEDRIEAQVETLAPGLFRVAIGENTHEIALDGDRVRIDGAPAEARVVSHAAGLSVFWGYGYHFEVVDPLAVDTSGGADAGVIEAPMPGLVKAVFVAAGQEVKEGDRLAILEAMKMEHTLSAGRDGVVAEVLASAGDQVEAGAALIQLEEDEA